MNRTVAFFAGAALLATASSAQLAKTDSLEGLWVAKQRFGPDVRGTLMLRPRDDVLVAEIAGFTVPVRQQDNFFTFELPDGKGSFRGVRSGRDIIGQWIQPTTIIAGRSLSTPLVLRADGRERWRGEVVPLNDRMTYYLPLARGTEGRYPTYLRNPERNQGGFIGATRLEQNGDVVRLVGRNRGQREESVIATGRRDPDSGRLSIPIQGTTFDFARDTDGSSAFYPRGNPPERYHYTPPVEFDDGWPVSTLEKEGIDRAAIERFVQKLIDMPMDNVSSFQIHGLLIARHGKLVLEEYFHGHDRDTPHDTRSASKSWVNVLIGAAMQAGVPIRLDTPIYQTMLGSVPADLDPRKKTMTLEHLISMTSGFDCNENNPNAPGHENAMQMQTEEPDWYRFALNLPMVSAPGESIAYCAVNPNLAGGTLERIAGEPQPELFQRLVARPLRIERYHLLLTPTGTAYGGGGHYFRSRDYLKLAQLMVNDGRWNGRQIVSRDWARKSTAALRLLSARVGQTYGHLWNSLSFPYRGRRLHAFFAAGNGTQIYMGIPELDLVIGFNGGNYGDRVQFQAQVDFVPKDILPAVN